MPGVFVVVCVAGTHTRAHAHAHAHAMGVLLSPGGGLLAAVVRIGSLSPGIPKIGLRPGGGGGAPKGAYGTTDEAFVVLTCACHL